MDVYLRIYYPRHRSVGGESALVLRAYASCWILRISCGIWRMGILKIQRGNIWKVILRFPSFGWVRTRGAWTCIAVCRTVCFCYIASHNTCSTFTHSYFLSPRKLCLSETPTSAYPTITHDFNSRFDTIHWSSVLDIPFFASPSIPPVYGPHSRLSRALFKLLLWPVRALTISIYGLSTPLLSIPVWRWAKHQTPMVHVILYPGKL